MNLSVKVDIVNEVSVLFCSVKQSVYQSRNLFSALIYKENNGHLISNLKGDNKLVAAFFLCKTQSITNKGTHNMKK